MVSSRAKFGRPSCPRSLSQFPKTSVGKALGSFCKEPLVFKDQKETPDWFWGPRFGVDLNQSHLFLTALVTLVTMGSCAEEETTQRIRDMCGIMLNCPFGYHPGASTISSDVQTNPGQVSAIEVS